MLKNFPITCDAFLHITCGLWPLVILGNISSHSGKKLNNGIVQGVQVQSGPFISSIVFIPLVVRGCNIHFIIQKGGENDAQLLKL